MKVVKSQNYELAAKLRDEGDAIMLKFEEEKRKWLEDQQLNKIPINVEDVYIMISNITGVPITKLDSKETDKLLSLEKILSNKVIGQSNAISTISKCIRRNRVGIKDTNKPIGSFIFLGSTGVGKTYLAKTLAEILFGDSEKMMLNRWV